MSRTLKDLLAKNPSVPSHECICSQFSKDERGMLERRSQALVDDSATNTMIAVHDTQWVKNPLPPFTVYNKVQ